MNYILGMEWCEYTPFLNAENIMLLIWSLIACEGDKLQSDTVLEEATEWIEPSNEHEPAPIIIEGVSIDCGDEYCHNDEVLTCDVVLSETGLETVFSWQSTRGRHHWYRISS